MDSRELRGLSEAYQAVYTPLTEDQVWESVEEWVNALIEEGYDLSDYTWEEMYGAYIEEASDLDMGLGRKVLRDRAKTAPRSPSPATPQPQLKGLSIGSGGFNINNKPATPTPTKPASATPTKSAATSPAAPRPAASTPARPAATAAPRPAAASSPTPAATAAAASKPATGMLGKTSFERRTPTSAELKAAQAARAGGEKDPEKVLQAAKAASAPATGNTLSQTTAAASKPAAFSPTPAVTPAAKPTPTSKPTPAATGSKKPGSIVSSFDYFDAVKGYLIGEGYADTEEAALAIMINMSEEWKQSIIKSI